MQTTPTDLDGWTMPPFSPIDGIEGLYLDDERVLLDAWSRMHAARVNARLPIARARVQVAEWQIANVAARGGPALTAHAEAFRAVALEEVRELEYRRNLLEASRVRDQAAREWRWA